MKANEWLRPRGAPMYIEWVPQGSKMGTDPIKCAFDTIAPNGDLIYKGKRKEHVFHILLIKKV